MTDLNLKTFNKLYPMMIRKYSDLIIDQNASEKDKINSIILKLNALGKLSNDVVRDWNTVYQWAMNDGLTQDVNNKLEDMLAKGQLKSITDALVAEIGDLTTLTTPQKDTVVHSINSLQSEVTTNTANIVSNTTQLSDIAINVKSPQFGAKGDGATNDTVAIQNAIDQAYSKGKSVWLPDGVYSILGNLNLKVSIDGVGTLLFKNTTTGKLNIPIGYDGITIKNISVDGNVVSTGSTYSSYIGNGGIINQSNDVKLFNVKVKNTNGVGIGNYGGHRFVVAYSEVFGCKNAFGDGIYSQNGDDCKFLYNYIHDFTRIGIVTDGVSGKSHNPLIEGNLIINAHDASSLTGGGELNGGIWIENTLGGKIVNNTMKQTNQRGIIVNPIIDDNKIYHYLIEGNTITDPIGTGIAIATGSSNNKTLANIDIKNNSVLGTYNVGISTGVHCNVNIDQCYFGSSTVQSLILTDMIGYVEKVSLTISNCSKGIITYSNPAVKDIHLFNKGMIDLTIKDMIGAWSYDMPDDQIIGTLKGINTSFVFDSSSIAYLCNFLTGGGNFTNCDFTINTAQQVGINTPSVLFNNCRLKSGDTTIRTLSFTYGAYDNNFIECKFDHVNITDLTQDATGNFKYIFKHTEFNEYGANGAIQCAFQTATTFDVRVLECTFKDSGNNVPIKKYNANPTKLIIRNAISPTASAVTGMTPTSEVGTLVA